MISNYVLYLNALPDEEKFKQISIILLFFGIVIIICVFLKFLQFKFMDENKNSLFQKFLKNL